MARMPVYRCKVTLAWWWPLYSHGLALACALMFTEPDWAKVDIMARKALRVRLVREADLDDGVADGE